MGISGHVTNVLKMGGICVTPWLSVYEFSNSDTPPVRQRREIPQSPIPPHWLSLTPRANMGIKASEEHRPDGMTFQRALIAQREGILEIRAGGFAARLDHVPAAPFDERPGQVQVALLARRAIQLHERHFQFGMAAETGPAVGTQEVPVRLVRSLPRDIEEGRLTRRGLVLQRRFDQVAQHVTVVRAVEEFGVPGPLARQEHVDVGVSIGPLCLGQGSNDLVDATLQLLIGNWASEQAAVSRNL